MNIALTKHQTAHLTERMQFASTLKQAADAATHRAQDAMAALNAAVTTLALDGGAEEGAEFEQFSITKRGEQSFLTLVEKPKQG